MHEAWPKTHHRAPPDLAIRQHRLCSGARPSAQPYVACATRSELLPITSRAGNDRNASPGELDFMHGGMTRRHEGSCEHDAHRKRLEYSTAGARLQGSVRRNGGCKTESTALRGVFRLDKAPDYIATDAMAYVRKQKFDMRRRMVLAFPHGSSRIVG